MYRLRANLPFFLRSNARSRVFSGHGRPRVTLSILIALLVSGCTTLPPAGLEAEYPPFERERLSLWGKFTPVSSLRPTLRWQPFPPPHQVEADLDGDLERLHDLRYELRVWRTKKGYSGKLVYQRAALPAPWHQLEENLEPAQKYLWSVRASFTLDGRPYVSEWGLATPYLRGYTVPNPACFRLRTPALPEDETEG